MKVLYEGIEPEQAKLLVMLLHGRGDTAENILGLSLPFQDLDGVCWMAPQAMNHGWYPNRFTVPRSHNEPYLTLALDTLQGLLDKFPPEQTLLAGFSQGACLVSDLLVRRPVRRAGAWIFSGGLIGQDDEWPIGEGALKGTPVLVTGSLQDPHIPAERMERTKEVLRSLGADITESHSQQASHYVSEVELRLAGELLETALKAL